MYIYIYINACIYNMHDVYQYVIDIYIYRYVDIYLYIYK